MKRFNQLLILMLCLILSGHCVFSQSDSTYQVSDSSYSRKTITNPFRVERSLTSYGTFSAHVDDSILFHTYAGSSVLNVLRGNVPSVTISPGITETANTGVRNGTSMYVIDGVPFHSDIYSSVNLNAFDFESVSVLSNANVAFPYAGPGSQGAFFLRSKTGETFDRPTFEFNSYLTRSIIDDNSSEFFSSAWNSGHSFAYKQDYGAVDLRASYNFSTSPYPSSDQYNGHHYLHAVKVNSGLNLGRFKARLIGEYRPQDWMQEPNEPIQNFQFSFESTRALLQANLFLEYQINKWLKATAQNALSKISADGENSSSTSTTNSSLDQKRNFHNLILSSSHALSQNVALRAFAGAQLDQNDINRTMSYRSDINFSESNSKNEINNGGIFGGIGADIHNVVFLDFNLRNDKYSLFPSDISLTTYASSMSFVFSRLFTTDVKFTGKLRSNYGRLDKYNGYLYPYLNDDFNLSQPPLSPRKMFELGFDLGFLSNRITSSFSYFKTIDSEVYGQISSPVPGPQPFFLIGDIHFSGYEAILGIIPVQTAKTRLKTNVIWYRNQSEIQSDDTVNGEPGTMIGNPNPDWQGSVFNQFSWNGFFLNVLLDLRRGGDYVVWSPGSAKVFDGSFTKFRDITLGYGFNASLLKKMNIQRAYVSLSGRNLIQFNDEDQDVERQNTFFVSYLKTISLSLSLSF